MISSRSPSRWLWSAWLIAGFGLGVVTSVALTSRADDKPSPYARLNTFAKVMSYIERSYIEPIPQSELIDGAIKGMVSRLDPHSAYLTVDEYRVFREENDGEFVGVGVEIGMRDGYIKVVSPIEGAPADRAGVASGDILVAIDGKPSRGWSLRDAIRRLKGKRGSRVQVEVLRPPTLAPGEAFDITRAVHKKFELTREVIDVVAVTARPMDGGVAYIRVRSFQQDVAADVEQELGRLEEAYGAPLRGVVLDLRNNPGGLLAEAVQLSDLFIDRGTLVTTEDRGRQHVETFEARPAATRTHAPMAVVVNGGSASASEIVAGAMQDRKRAVIVGSRSFGKGSVQSIIDMKDGSGLKLTTGRYFTPDHRSIQGKGVVPDVKVQAGQRVSDGEPSGGQLWYRADPQLRMAHEQLLLRGKSRPTGREK